MMSFLIALLGTLLFAGAAGCVLDRLIYRHEKNPYDRHHR